ncbi:MAG TPA: hypothetical protein VJ953_13920 [Saprospiraceae bacterium]|nr:hypothetical protein [Saprospiraceae bacterium]
MQYFNISLVTVMLRFYLMMGFVIVGVFTGMHLLTILALPTFLSIMLGITFKKEKKKATTASIPRQNKQKNAA